MASRSSEVNFTKNYTLLYLYLYLPVLYISRTFLWAKFTSRIICLCLEPLRSYLASKLTILENSQKFKIYGVLGELLGGSICLADSMPLCWIVKKLRKKSFKNATYLSWWQHPWGTTTPCHTLLESSHRAHVKFQLTCNAATCSQMAYWSPKTDHLSLFWSPIAAP